MAEFFVVRAYRKRGVGLAAAHQVWRLFPGPWQIRVLDVNRPAMLFWQGAIDSFTGRYVAPAPINRDGRAWAVFMFDSNA
jgi:predicted acetyltransferase